MGQYDQIIGALAVASWLNSILWAIELQQGIRYFTTFKNDSTPARLLVSFVLIIDSIGSLALCANVYLYCITHWGDEVFLGKQNLAFTVIVVTDGLSVITLHSFLIIRVYRLSKQYFLSAILGLVALASLGGALVLTAMLVKYPHYEDRGKLYVPAIVWVAASTGADILIAVTLLVLLQKVKKQASEFGRSQLTRPMRILSRSALETGGIPAAWTTLALAVYLWRDKTNLAPAMLAVVGRISGLTLIYNLNLRSKTADSLMNGDGGLNSHSQSTSGGNSGMFKRWRRTTNGRPEDQGVELSVAVNTVTETRHEHEDDGVRVVTLPPAGRPIHSEYEVKPDGVTFA